MSDESMRPEWVEIGWTDADGCHGHVIVGEWLRTLGSHADVVARIEVRAPDGEVWQPVDVPRAHAETLHAALGAFLRAEDAGLLAALEGPPSDDDAS
jgi:hypothetical protein